MKRLTIRWQRLVNEKNRTCPRCGSTGEQVEKAVKTLGRRLRPLGIEVRSLSRALSQAAFERDPQSSNRIWIGAAPLERWLEAKPGKSRCCGACGRTPCRTLRVGERTYAAVPARLIVRAGLRAAGIGDRKGR